jgi:hypothetical protein
MSSTERRRGPSRAAIHSFVLMSAAAAMTFTDAAPASPPARHITLEGLASLQGRNDAQVPNDASGTRFAIDDITDDGPFVSPRVELSWPITARQEIRGLVAPLTVDESGSTATPIRFQGATFAAGAIDAKYRFDSYRVTWRYLWIDRDDLTVKVGFTAKIRDASIRLRQGNLSAVKNDTGFVPLLHAALDRRLTDDWLFQADIDALAGGPGYAVDLGARFGREFGNGWVATAGIRFLDGGADNDDVYTFARFTSFALGIGRRF